MSPLIAAAHAPRQGAMALAGGARVASAGASTSVTQVSPDSAKRRVSIDVLVLVLWQVIAMEGSPSVLAELATVCRRWHAAATSRALWHRIARRFFVAYPLTSLLALASDTQPTAGAEAAPVNHPQHHLQHLSYDGHTRPGVAAPSCRVGGQQVPVSRELVQRSHEAVWAYREQSSRYHIIEQQRRYVVNLLACFTLLAACICASCFVVAMELHSVHSGVVVAIVKSLISYDAAFGFAWLFFYLMCGTVIANTVMDAFFDPQPLAQRLRRHWRLVATSSLIVGSIALCLGGPLYMVQANMLRCYTDAVPLTAPARGSASVPISGPLANGTLSQGAFVVDSASSLAAAMAPVSIGGADSVWQMPLACQPYSWTTVFAPLVVGLLAWQVQVLVSIDWSGEALTLSPRVLWRLGTHLTPLWFAMTVQNFVWYLETGRALYVTISAVPLVTTFGVLTFLFSVDYGVSGDTSDGAAALCLFFAMWVPLTPIFCPVRGLTLLPLVLSFGGAFISYSAHTLRLMRTLDESGSFG